MRVYRQDTVGEWNTEIPTACMVMAATGGNTTAITNKVGYSDVDEMALSFITSRWAQINNFPLSTAATAGTLIYATPITPLAFWFRAFTSVPAYNKNIPTLSSAGNNSIQPSHVMFAASCFKQWRGGFKFRFTFAKTKMHAGRVMICYNPYLSNDSIDTFTGISGVNVASYGTLGPDPFGYSAIFDLKDDNIFEFEIPFVSPIPYASLTTTVGALAMYVVNPLIAPSMVSPTVSVMVEVCGASDFQVSNPVGILLPVHNAGTIRLQSGRQLSESASALDEQTMGETIMSVKQLISIPHITKQNPGNPGGILTVPPWYYQPTPSVLVPAVNTFLRYSFSFGGNWASCYAFLKGGTDVHVYGYNKDSSYTLFQNAKAGGSRVTNTAFTNRTSGNAPFQITMQSVLHARLPAFFPTSRVYSWIANALSASGASIADNPFIAGTNAQISPYTGIQAAYMLGYSTASNPAANAVFCLNRNAADDAQLAHYIGPPPMFLPSSAATGYFDNDFNSGMPL